LAGLELMREQQEAEEARESWRGSGLTGEPESSLVLRGPQIDAAKVQVEAARAARDWAARQLELTEIRAPFSAIVAARHVSRGESVLEGEAVAEIFATEVFEVALKISEDQWRALAVPIVGTAAELVDPEGPGRWRAEVVRVGGSIDPTTRMRTLYLEVTDPLDAEPPLLPGSFVRAHIRGGEVDRALELPEGALTRSGHVWYLDDDDTLRRFATEPLFTREGWIYVSEPSPASTWRIVRYPLDSFMVGQAVRAGNDGRGKG
ncbi:MAG: HlyD family efflux transporter periplasmic adaptor subunit, partial [Holophagales bacterium]|nr:HlyD family efflux transporter periplasmic adaptor subunit [Holophagales bacterium]